MPTALREVETVSRERKRRTRSRTISHLDALVVSTLKPHEYDLDPTCISLVCPSCRTWVPIRVAATKRATAKLVPHHTETAGTEDPVRCPGSHRLVVINVDMERWRRRLEEGVAETNGRRSDRVVRKPQAKPAPAVMQMIGAPVDDKKARKLEEAHVKGCTTCSPRKDENSSEQDKTRRTTSFPDIASRCADGRRLAQLAAHTKRVGPVRRKVQMEQEDWNDRRAWALRLLHEQQWDAVSGAVREADVRRLRDQLEAMCWSMNPKTPNGPRLSAWEQADLLSSVILLAKQLDQLDR
ncbi:hypothetical protein [Streptomyces atratus]|uniref:hypothetical protein n=1 Tax=Streptomyces atratus TaxID=1893 RepID=UPI00225757F3|nr:hypothetical protein [Streptomyces atratus]MCX5345903.1 hypothetical protein [Streptomyces atratus]